MDLFQSINQFQKGHTVVNRQLMDMEIPEDVV